MVFNILEFLGRHATHVLAVGVLTGLAVPQLSELMRPLLIPGLVIPLTIALVRMDWTLLAAYGRRLPLMALLAAWLLLVSPVAVAGLTAHMGLPDALRTAVVLMAAAPPIVSSAALALILGLDAALAVVGIVLATALLPLTLPPMALWLLGLEINISLAELMFRLAALVGFAFFAAWTARRLVPRIWIERNSTLLDGMSVATLLMFAIAIMAGVTDVLLARPSYVALVLVAAFIANLLLQGAGLLMFLWLGRREALTLGLLTGNCNMGLILVALADRAEFDVVVYFALGQIPMYMLPALLRPVYQRLMRG